MKPTRGPVNPKYEVYSMNNNSIGSFLAALRKANGLTQKQLAEKLNVSDKAVSRWERDECAPDLSLIPVLAELYGVTSDEILRGQRAAPESQPKPQAEERSQKRLQYMLSRIQTRYKIQSIISVGIAVVGLIAAMILNLIFLRAQAGFLVGCIFLVAATVCQIIFIILGNSAITQDEFDDRSVTACKHFMTKGAEIVFSVIFFILSATVPLLYADDPYWGITLPYWTEQAIFVLIIPALVCPTVCHSINSKLGISKRINWKSPANKLRIRTALILLAVLFVTAILHWFAAFYLSENPQLYGDATEFTTLEDFKAYMEQPISDDGTPLTYHTTYQDAEGQEIEIYLDSENNEYWYYTDWITGVICDAEGNELCRYSRYNESVVNIVYSNSDDRLPIYTMNRTQYRESSTRFNWLMAAWIPLYLAEAVILILRYRKKAKDLKG